KEEGRHGKRYTLNLLSFDFGGGTIDLALIQAQLELYSHNVRLRLSLLGSDSCDFGGDQVTLAIFRILKRRLAMALCDSERLRKEMTGEPEQVSTIQNSWLPQRLVASKRSGYDVFLLPDGSSKGWSPSIDWLGLSDGTDSCQRVLQQNWGYLAARIMGSG